MKRPNKQQKLFSSLKDLLSLNGLFERFQWQLAGQEILALESIDSDKVLVTFANGKSESFELKTQVTNSINFTSK